MLFCLLTMLTLTRATYQCQKIKALTKFHIKLTACEMWNFMRLFPLMMGSYVKEGDPTWDLLGQLINIVERVCSPSFKEIDIVHLDYVIKNCFNDYYVLFPEAALKPKSHFIFHYPEMIRKFGPLVKFDLRPKMVFVRMWWLILKITLMFVRDLLLIIRCTCIFLTNKIII